MKKRMGLLASSNSLKSNQRRRLLQHLKLRVIDLTINWEEAMESNMSERLIGVKPETAIQSFTASLSVRERLPIIGLHLKTFRIAVFSVRAALQFFNGIDSLDVDSQDKEQTERSEEVNNIGSSNYCHQCDQLATVTVGVDITGTLCQGCFMEEYGAVSSFHPAMPSESEPSATDSDGHGTWVIPPNQTVLDIVDGTNGSALNRSPLHSIGSHDYNSYGQTHKAPGHDDSNHIRSLSISVGSDHGVTNNNVPGHMGHFDSRLEEGLVSHSSGANTVPDQPHHATEVPKSFWIFSATGFGFEAVSAFFDQVSSPQKPHYALYGMLLSVLAVLVCILDLILNAKTSGSDMLWGILPEVFGLALACVQCISSVLQFSFICRHAANPVKVSLVPFLFFFVLFAFKYRNGRNIRLET